jgi:Tfp pilus assembly protein PilF
MKLTEPRADCLIVFTASMAVYLATICPTIAAGDSGDLITAAYTLGIAHPAGYPLYTLLGKLFTLIPYGSIAYRVNLLSTVAAALTAVLCCLTVRLLTENRIASIGAGLAVAYSRTLWNQAVVAETYTLNAFFIAALIYIAVLWRKHKDIKYLHYLAFTYGLGLTNHVSLVFYMPAFAYFIYSTDRRVLKERVVGRMALFLMGGLLLYLYLPARASMNPAYNWGDPSTPGRFISHVTGFVHRQLYAYPSVEVNFLQRARNVLKLLLKQYSLVWILAFMGYKAVKKDRGLIELTLLIGCIDFIYTVFLNTVSLEITAFEIPTAVAAGIWIGFGLKMLLKHMDVKSMGAGLTVVVVVAGIELAGSYGVNNYGNNIIAFDYGVGIVNTLEDGAVIFAEGDNNILILSYLLLAEGMRPDVTLIERSGFLSHSVYGSDFLFLPESEHQKRQDEVERRYIESGRPVYYSIRRDMSAFPGRDLVQTGLVFRVVGVNESFDVKDYWSGYMLRGGEDPSTSRDYMTRDIIATYHMRRGEHYFKENKTSMAITEFSEASRLSPDNPVVHYNLGNIYLNEGMPEKAAYEFERVIILDPLDPKAHNNLGYAYTILLRFEDARREYFKAIQLDPTYTMARFNLAGMLLQSGRVSEAVSEYEAIIRQDPTYASAYRNVGAIYYNTGVQTNNTEYIKKAVGYWKEFVELSPDNPQAGAIKAKIAEIEGFS